LAPAETHSLDISFILSKILLGVFTSSLKVLRVRSHQNDQATKNDRKKAPFVSGLLEFPSDISVDEAATTSSTEALLLPRPNTFSKLQD